MTAPGIAYAARRAIEIASPPITITAPAPGIRVERDVPIEMPDGTRLRVNVFRPDREGRFPAIASAHPYGKDVLPRRTPLGYMPLKRYRFIRQPAPITFSALTGWEAPDPSFWVTRGYAVVNVDLRGFGTSEGLGSLLSRQEGEDYARAIEWIGEQPWCTGRVGLNGVSYLAISQWRVASLRPRHLAAICPWEGFTDAYRDVAYPGGVREDGFMPFWANMTEREGHAADSLREGQLAHPCFDDFWESRTPALERIDVPALVCASFSDQGLHTRGSFEAFRRIGSREKFLYTHRGGKWSTYYSREALELQARFFDCFLQDAESGMRDEPRVRLEIRSSEDEIRTVRAERAWPPPNIAWKRLHLAPNVLRDEPLRDATAVRFAVPRGQATFEHRVRDDVEIVGPMKLRLHVELTRANDAHLFVAVRKIHRGREVAFEGAYGFGCDVVAKGWVRVALRRVDESRSEPHRPFQPCDRLEPVAAGEIVPVDVEILPSATFFAAGDVLRLDVCGRSFWRHDPFFGTYPATYAASPRANVTLHLGSAHDAYLLVPTTSS